MEYNEALAVAMAQEWMRIYLERHPDEFNDGLPDTLLSKKMLAVYESVLTDLNAEITKSSYDK